MPTTIELPPSAKQAPNIVKVRDDHRPLYFSADGEKFKLQDGGEASWLSDGQEFGQKELRERIEPWLTSLFQSEHLSLLAGSGLTHAVHHLATGTGAAGMDAIDITCHHDKINAAAEKSAKEAGRKKGNVEDQLRVANELVRGLEILQDVQADVLRKDLRAGMREFAMSILKSERGIATAQESQREQAFNTLVTFLMSFASRTGTRDRLSIFTTNYDRLIEAGAELAGLHLLDRFLGNLMPIFRSSRLDVDMHYNPPGVRGEPRFLEGVARFIKLHGSVDWVQTGKNIRRVGLPFGVDTVEPYLKAPGLSGATAYELMIYPNAAKDRETADYPYVELFRDLAVAVCRPNSTLVTYGYSFGDEHVNRVIRDMLTIPSTHLVVISHGDPLGRVMQTYEQIGRPSQISLLLGPALANLTTLTENYLPKAAIDKATFRMSELLKQRFGTQQGAPKIKGTDAVEVGDEL